VQLREPAAPLEQLDLPLEDVDGVGESRREAGGPVGAHVRIRVLPLGQRDHARGDAVAEQLEPRPERGLEPAASLS
jgi:hypothetical protein